LDAAIVLGCHHSATPW